jgi:hypothetical protein
MTPRQEVYAALDSERDYQDSRWGATLSANRVPGPGQEGGDRSLDEFVLYMKGYVDDAVAKASHFVDKVAVLDIIRKVTALGVACMEQHGAPRR